VQVIEVEYNDVGAKLVEEVSIPMEGECKEYTPPRPETCATLVEDESNSTVAQQIEYPLVFYITNLRYHFVNLVD
jgi:hypothetical protein